MQHVAQLHDDDQEGDEQHVAAVIARNVEAEQGGHVAGAEDADHQRPLHLGDADQEVLRIAPEGRQDRHEQEGVDRNEDRIEAVPFGGDQVVLHRQDDEEGGCQRPVIGAARVGQRDELAQRRKRAEGEKHDDAGAPGDEGKADQRHHHPPGIDPGIEVFDGRVRPVRRQALLEDEADRRGKHQNAADAEEKQEEVGSGSAHGRVPS